MSALVLADYEPRFAAELVPMWRASFEHGVGIVDPHPLAEQHAFFANDVLPDHAVKVALLDAALCGFVAATPESINQLYVRVGYSGQGIGTCLLEWAKAQSSGSLWLYTFAQNTIARRFYERHGFTVVAQGYEPMWNLADVKYRWQRTPDARQA